MRANFGRVPLNLFVYGTLKQGYHNHRLLKGAEFIGRDEAPGVIYNGYVPIVRPITGSWVKGEVYRVVDQEQLLRIDRLEGHPHSYTRRTVTLRSGAQADIYYWERETYNEEPLPSGEWHYPYNQRRGGKRMK